MREHAVLEVVREELALRVVAREAERRLRQVVRAEREEVGMCGDLVCAHACARQLDHRSDEIREVASFLGRDANGELAQPAQLLGERHERVHDLDLRRLAGALAHGQGGPHDRADLHLVDLGPLQAEPAAACPQHRVRLVQRQDPVSQALVGRLFERREELVQRRVEQPDRHRQPRHRLEDALEVALLEGQEPVERGAASRLVVREDHLLDDRQALVAEEHVLRAAEPDPLSAELARLCRVGRACPRSRAPPAAGRRPPSRGSSRGRR